MRSENRVPKSASVRGAEGHREAFTLVELLVVIAIIGILLAVAGSALSSTGTSERRAARGEIQGLLTRARSHAISSGDPTALVMIGLASGPDDMRGKVLSLFEVKRNVASGDWEVEEQLRRWLELPGSTILMDGSTVGATSEKGSNVLDEAVRLTVEVPSGTSGSKIEVEASFVVFESTGAVSHPSGSGRVEFYIGQGVIRSGRLTVTEKTSSGAVVADRVVLSRLTGRAQAVASTQG